MKNSILFIAILSLFVSPALAADAPAKEPIKIGEMLSYAALPDAASKWQQGWKLAQAEINQSGGVFDGHLMEILSRDDKGSPAETVKILEDYRNRENIKIVIGTIQSHTGLAASSYAEHNGMLMFRGYAGTSKLTAENGHDHYFQIMPSTTVWAGILSDKAEESQKKRWAVIAADYEFSRSIVADFQTRLKHANPEVSFLDTQWFPIGKADAGAIAQTVNHAQPDGIFVVAYGPDYLRIVREGRKIGLFDNRFIISPFAGNADFIRPLGNEAPIGWYSTYGYPLDKIQGDKHKHFVQSFKAAYNDEPTLASFLAYSSIKVLAEAIRATKSQDPETLTRYIKSHAFNVPGYTITFRADGTSSLGEWAGYTGFVNGVPTITNPDYFPPEKYMPAAEDNMKLWKK